MFTYIVNLKNYPESTGTKTELIVMGLSQVKKDQSSILLAVPSTHLLLSKKYKQIISQHVDSMEPGPFTGKVIIDDLLEMGIKASLLNHSENRISMEIIQNTIQRAETNDFELFICSRDLNETEKLCKIGAKNIAYEPIELIGGDISVSTARPHIIAECVEVCERSGANLLVGAGIKTLKDVKIARELGASGVLVSSGIVRSTDPKNALNSLMI